jgi:hypothetical protein
MIFLIIYEILYNMWYKLIIICFEREKKLFFPSSDPFLLHIIIKTTFDRKQGTTVKLDDDIHNEV